jgi:hypothetical protein
MTANDQLSRDGRVERADTIKDKDRDSVRPAG